MANDKNGPSTVGLQAVAESNFTLELNPVPGHVDNIMPHIKSALPVYSSTGHWQAKDLLVKQQLFTNVPFSERECVSAWEYMACFEIKDPAGCFIPSGQAKVQAWKSIMQEAAALNVDITERLSLAQAEALIPQTTDLPMSLVEAVRDAVALEENLEKQGQEWVFVRKSCIMFVGLSQLEASTQGKGPVSKADFMAAWADLLPEKWRLDAHLEMLKGQYVLQTMIATLRSLAVA